MTSTDPAIPSRVPSPGSRPRWATAACLIVILALAAFLRWHDITRQGFFFDELWNLEVANGHDSIFFELPFDRVIELENPLVPVHAKPIWRLPRLVAGITHPPAVFVSLRVWRDLFGDSMFSLRSWSASASLISVVLVFVAGLRSFGKAAGLWAALLCAVSLGSIDQAQDARGYSMLQCVLLLCVIAFLYVRRSDGRWPGVIALGVAVLLLMLTHYLAIGVAVTLGVASLLMLRGRTRVRAIGALVVAGVVWCVCWLPFLREQLAVVKGTADVFLTDDSPSPPIATIARFIAVPYTSLVGDPDPLSNLALAGGTAVWIAIGFRLFRRGTGESAAMTWLWIGLALAAVAPHLTLDLLRQTKHLSFPRYVVIAVPALCVLLGSLPPLWRRLPLPAVVAAALVVAYLTTMPTQKPDLRPHIAYLQQRHAAPGDLFLLPGRVERPRDAQSRYLSLAYGLPWPRHRIALPIGPKSIEWIDALPRDGRWFCLAFADYDPAKWQPGLTVVDRGPIHRGVAVYEVRRSDPR